MPLAVLSGIALDATMSGLTPVRDTDQLDWGRIDAYVRARVVEVAGAPPLAVQQFANGAANLTYLLRFGDRELVLRRPPFGAIAPGAHDMKREWRALSRLWRSIRRASPRASSCRPSSCAAAWPTPPRAAATRTTPTPRA